MKTLCKVLLALLALFPVPALIWLALPQFSLLWPCRAYWRGYAVSLALTVPVVAGQLAVALAAAYGLTRWRGRARSSVLLLYCLLPLLPSQVMLLPNYLICRALGLLNTQLAVVLLGVFSPLSVFLLAHAMGRVGPEQAQAAALDGAGEWTLLRRPCGKRASSRWRPEPSAASRTRPTAWRSWTAPPRRRRPKRSAGSGSPRGGRRPCASS